MLPNKRVSVRSLLLYLLVSMILLFLLIPTLLVIPVSLGGEEHLQFPPNSFSLRWYVEYFQDEDWVKSTLFSLQTATITTVVATIIGTMAALALVRGRVIGSGFLNNLILTPIIVPLIVTAVAVYSVFIRFHLIGTTLGFVLAHTVLVVPYVVLTVSASLYRFDPNQELAAMNLGASRLQAIWKVTLPQVMHGVVSGAAFAFIMSFDEAIVSFFLSDLNGKTLPKKIFENIDFGVDPTVAVAGTVLSVTSLLVMSGIEFFKHWINIRVSRQRSGGHSNQATEELSVATRKM